MKRPTFVIASLLCALWIAGCDGPRTSRDVTEPGAGAETGPAEPGPAKRSADSRLGAESAAQRDVSVASKPAGPSGGQTASADKGEKGQPDQEDIRGTWIVVAAQYSGEPKPNSIGERWTYDKDSLTCVSKAGVTEVYSYQLDASKTPRELSVLSKDDGFLVIEIYSLEGDTLKVCFSYKNNDVPKEFVSKRGDGRFLVVLKRAEAGKE